MTTQPLLHSVCNCGAPDFILCISNLSFGRNCQSVEGGDCTTLSLSLPLSVCCCVAHLQVINFRLQNKSPKVVMTVIMQHSKVRVTGSQDRFFSKNLSFFCYDIQLLGKRPHASACNSACIARKFFVLYACTDVFKRDSRTVREWEVW